VEAEGFISLLNVALTATGGLAGLRPFGAVPWRSLVLLEASDLESSSAIAVR